MRRSMQAIIAVVGTLLLGGGDWLSFRGPDSTGVAADGQTPPTEWNIVSGQNIAWKTPLPGRGLSAPLIIDGKAYVTACSGFRQDRLHVLCFDAKDGKPLWERQFWATGRTLCHESMSVASNSPASDGERIFALFSTNDLVCLDLAGDLQWYRGLTLEYPNAGNSLGMASSPIVSNGVVVVQIESDADSYALGIDAKSGENRWTQDRPRVANWTSPVPLPGKTPADDLVLLQSAKGLAAHKVSTGEKMWSFDEDCSTIPSATVSDSVIYLPSNGLTALATGQGTEPPKPLWKENRLGPGTASPVVYRGKVYTIARGGILKCADVKTGEQLWQLRTKGSYSATPIAADGKLYMFNDEGLGQVIDLAEGLSPDARLLGVGDLVERIYGTPAIVDGAIYVRSDAHLWKLAKTP